MPKCSLGDHVTVKERVEAYYSDYGGNEKCYLETDDVGIVASVNVPVVRHRKGFAYTFNCVDFVKDGKTWRCAIYDSNLVKIKA